MKLAYKAVDKSGRVTNDSIEAVSTQEANDKLRQRGLFVTEINESKASAAGGVKPARRVARSVKNLALWTRQLCVLVRSGTPLAQALAAIERQTSSGPWKDVLTDLREKVEEGIALSDAMSLHPGMFDEVSRSLVAAGESSGQLGLMLDRVATLSRQQLKTRRALTGAMIYPALLVGVGLVVTLVMLLAVIPRFSELFDSLNAGLPPTTKFLMVLSNGLRSYWWAVLLGMGALFFGVRTYLRSATGRRALDGWLVAAPHFGTVMKSIATARIARLLGVMLESRVPLLDALGLARYTTGNRLYSDLMCEATEAATRGESISGVFSRSPLISPSVSEAIRHGEQNAQIGPIMTDMADFLDEENEVIVKTAMSVLEPLILIALGLVVGFIALSLFIPLFDLTATAGVQS